MEGFICTFSLSVSLLFQLHLPIDSIGHSHNSVSSGIISQSVQNILITKLGETTNKQSKEESKRV